MFFLIDIVVDKKLSMVFQAVGMTYHFAMPWIITWFAHSVKDFKAITELYEFFIGQHPVVPVYTTVALVTHPVVRYPFALPLLSSF